MSEQNAPEEGATNGGNAGTYTPPATQDDLDRIISDRLARERAKFADYDDLKAKAAEHDKYVDAQKSEAEKLTEALAEERAKNEALARENLVTKVAAEKSVPAALLSGDTEEALIASAEALIAFRGEQERAPRGAFVPNEGRSPSNPSSPDAEALSILGFGG